VWWIESGAGTNAGFEDQIYSGTATVKDRSTILKEADVIVTIFSPRDEDLNQMKAGAPDFTIQTLPGYRRG
jgi:NAD/NADP transhydrogenase alpha subunit